MPNSVPVSIFVIDRYGNFHVTDTDTDMLIITDADADADTDADTDTDKKETNSSIPIRRKIALNEDQKQPTFSENIVVYP